jgi:hypothetical protein
MRLQPDRARYDACPPYNEWLDRTYVEANGELDILAFRPRPSEVLFQMSPDTYEAAFADFEQLREEELKHRVFQDFPTPIAHYFYRFDTGYENDLQRLHFLRDTWESIVDVIHAIAVAECRFRGVSLAHPARFSDLLSDSVAQRLINIERLMQQAADGGAALKISQIVPLTTLTKMRELNQSRNGFSHSAAQSEAQARTWIGECYGDVIDVLDDIKGLADIDVYRYLGQVDGQTLRCESFYGHGFTRTIKAVALSSSQVAASQRFFQQGQMLVACEGDLFGLRPLVFFREDTAGHITKLCLFRRTHGDAPNRRVEFEIVGEAVRHSEDRAVVQTEINELRALFGLGPE